MRNRFVLTRIILIIGLLGTPGALIWAQEAPVSLSSPPKEQTVTVAGRVLGQAPLKDAEALAVLLLPGWSEALNAEVARGRAPMILLDAGKVERILAAPSDANPRPTVSFEFPNVRPGEYQAVAVKIEKGADRGAVIAVGSRVVVEDRDIANIDLEITAPPLEAGAPRQGGAKDREATVVDSNRPLFDPLPPPHIGPFGSTPPPPSGNTISRKREVLEQIIVGVGLATAMILFSLW